MAEVNADHSNFDLELQVIQQTELTEEHKSTARQPQRRIVVVDNKGGANPVHDDTEYYFLL